MSATLVRTDALPPAALYCLRLGDDALVMAQRLGEWLARAPQIEEDMALGNIALDLLGQARALLTHAGELSAAAGGPAYTEDDLAYWRDERSFVNVQLVEQERGDFAVTIVRLLVLSTWQCHLYAALATSTDPVLSAVAAKAVKEVDYHRDHARQWTLRLGLGTDLSHAKMVAALAAVAPYVEELFDDDELTETLAAQGIAVRPSEPAAGRAQRPRRGAGRRRPRLRAGHLAGAGRSDRAALDRDGPTCWPSCSTSRGRTPEPPGDRDSGLERDPATTSLDAVRRAVEAVVDPELPVLTLAQLGVIRDVRRAGTRRRRGSWSRSRRPTRAARRWRSSPATSPTRSVRPVTRSTSGWCSRRPGRRTGSPTRAGRCCRTTASPRRAGCAARAGRSRCPASGPDLSSVRRQRRRGARPVRLDRLPVPVAVPVVSRAVQPGQAPVTATVETPARVRWHELTVAAVEPLTDDAVAVTVDVPRGAGRRLRVRARAAPDPAPGGRRAGPAAVLLDLRDAGLGRGAPPAAGRHQAPGRRRVLDLGARSRCGRATGSS